MPEEREDVETKSSDSPEVYQQTKFMTWFEKAFPWLLVSGAALGLTLMIILPIIFFQEKTGDQLKAQSDLRLALLYTTGGAVAALGLLETYRKNTNDRAKANADINATLKNQEHQTKVLKEQIRQFDENAFKERKAERRERYTKAVEQLGDEKAPIRMGGVYTLVGLVDEWLEEKSLSDDERFKEGQVIINNLCAYIRSPFTLATRYDELSKDSPSSDGIYKDNQQEFYTDKAEFKAEADVRLGIIKEIHDRIQGPDKNTPGAWSDFEYDFSGSTFFYPIDLTNSYYAKPINFSGSTYQGGANFSHSTYEGWANFRGSTYQGVADFTGSTYQGGAYFSRSTYQGGANFSRSTYKNGANFSDSTYRGWADFSDSTYQGWANFSGSIYTDLTIFRGSIYTDLANFRSSTYQSAVYFNGSTYRDRAGFSNSIYQGGADLSRSIYRGKADFSRSIFYRGIYFDYSIYSDSFSRFLGCAPQFYDERNRKNTLFGSPDNDFTVDTSEGYPIDLNSEGLPLSCNFLTAEQKEYLADKFQEIEKINNKLLEAKDEEENTQLLDTLGSLTKELDVWRERVITVKVEGTAPEEEDN